MLELIYALTEIHESSPEKLEKIRAVKAEKRGGFREKLLKATEESNQVRERIKTDAFVR